MLLPTLSATTAFASTACATGDVVWNEGVSTGYSCTLNNLDFSNFTVIGTSNDPDPTVTISQPLQLDGPETLLSFNPNEGSNFDIDIYFEVQTTDGSFLTGIDLTVGGNNANVSERVCSNTMLGNPGNICSPTGSQLASISNFSGQPTVEAQLSSATSTIFVFKNVGTQPGGALSTVSEDFTTSAIPEPMSLFSVGAGFALILLLRRKQVRA